MQMQSELWFLLFAFICVNACVCVWLYAWTWTNAIAGVSFPNNGPAVF